MHVPEPGEEKAMVAIVALVIIIFIAGTSVLRLSFTQHFA